MKKQLVAMSLVMAMGLTLAGCGNGQAVVNNPTATATSAPSTKQKIYVAGEEAIMTDTTGKQMYSLKINSVKVANDFFTDYNKDTLAESNKKQVVEVDYTYKNIAKADESKLYIATEDLLVADITGAVSQPAFYYPKLQPQQIPVGMNCTVQGYYGLANVSDKVKISFSSLAYKKTITFEIPVQK